MPKYEIESEVQAFKDKEHDHEQDVLNRQLDEAVNGCHSGTKIAEKFDGTTTLELHYNPVIKKLVEMSTWYVQDGEDVMPEFEVLGVYDTTTDARRLAVEYN